MLGFPVQPLVAIIEKNRGEYTKPFYNISQLADRWKCSRATVYNVLRDAKYKALNLADRKKHSARLLADSCLGGRAN